MDILTKLIVLLLCFYWYINKKSVSILLLSIFFLIEFSRKLFLDEVLTPNLLSYLTLLQLSILIIAGILYVKSVIKVIKK